MIQQIIDDKIAYNKAQVLAIQQEIDELELQKSQSSKKMGIEKWLNNDFESSSGLTDEFAQFAREYKKHIMASLPKGAELVNFNRGHFYISGFVKRENNFVYFSCDDVRGSNNGWYESILIRTAKHDKDYTGGSNNFTSMPNFTKNVEQYL